MLRLKSSWLAPGVELIWPRFSRTTSPFIVNSSFSSWDPAFACLAREADYLLRASNRRPWGLSTLCLLFFSAEAMEILGCLWPGLLVQRCAEGVATVILAELSLWLRHKASWEALYWLVVCENTSLLNVTGLAKVIVSALINLASRFHFPHQLGCRSRTTVCHLASRWN